MQGENFVRLVGKITYPKAKPLDNNGYMFKAKLAIPTQDSPPRYQYIKINAWGSIAEDLGALPSGSYIKIHGHIEESSFESQCQYCSGPSKVFWTEVLVSNFIVIE